VGDLIGNRDLRFGNFRSNQITNRIGGVVVYVFNADCHRNYVGLMRTTQNYVIIIIIIIIIISHLYSAYYRKKERSCYSKN